MLHDECQPAGGLGGRVLPLYRAGWRGVPPLWRVQRLKLPRDAQLKTETRADLFDGVVTLKADALAIKEGDWQALYRTDPPQDEKATLTALPYYLWANRGQGSMVVWVPEVQ